MFTLTPELHNQITTYQVWYDSIPTEDKEPFNPWPDVVLQMKLTINHINIGWGSHEELVTDYIESAGNDFIDHIMSRYKVGSMDAYDINEQMKQFKPLQQYS